MRTVNVLGTQYTIEIRKIGEDKVLDKNGFAAYCCNDMPLIVIADLEDEGHFEFESEAAKNNYFKECLRHEIVHAFLNESGLKNNFEHANRMGHEETMIDWIAIQFPKLQKAFEEVGVL